MWISHFCRCYYNKNFDWVVIGKVKLLEAFSQGPWPFLLFLILKPSWGFYQILETSSILLAFLRDCSPIFLLQFSSPHTYTSILPISSWNLQIQQFCCPVLSSIIPTPRMFHLSPISCQILIFLNHHFLKILCSFSPHSHFDDWRWHVPIYQYL